MIMYELLPIRHHSDEEHDVRPATQPTVHPAAAAVRSSPDGWKNTDFQGPSSDPRI